jgi:hypothetical protein
MMKKLSCFLLAVLLYSCDKDKASPALPVACMEIECPVVTEEFYSVGLMNGECWAADGAVIDTFSQVNFLIVLASAGLDGITESLLIDISRTTDLRDTIWLGWNRSFTNPRHNVAHTWYSYLEDHSVAGEFKFGVGTEVTYNDYLLIDYFNADTSIVEGRFEVRFPERSVSGFVTHAPDTMNIRCGKFRAKAF